MQELADSDTLVRLQAGVEAESAESCSSSISSSSSSIIRAALSKLGIPPVCTVAGSRAVQRPSTAGRRWRSHACLSTLHHRARSKQSSHFPCVFKT